MKKIFLYGLLCAGLNGSYQIEASALSRGHRQEEFAEAMEKLVRSWESDIETLYQNDPVTALRRITECVGRLERREGTEVWVLGKHIRDLLNAWDENAPESEGEIMPPYIESIREQKRRIESIFEARDLALAQIFLKKDRANFYNALCVRKMFEATDKAQGMVAVLTGPKSPANV